jgi:hypothetical protein
MRMHAWMSAFDGVFDASIDARMKRQRCVSDAASMM